MGNVTHLNSRDAFLGIIVDAQFICCILWEDNDFQAVLNAVQNFMKEARAVGNSSLSFEK